MELELGFNVHIRSKLLRHMFLVGASSSGLRQPFRVWVGERAGYLATTSALKERYRPVETVITSLTRVKIWSMQCFSEKINSKWNF